MRDGEWFAPGRVTVIGEHTDYNDGFVLPIAVPMGVRCRAAERDDGIVTVSSRQRRGDTVTAPVADLDRLRDRMPSWARYPLGVVAEFARRGHGDGGIDLAVDGTVPIGAGLSSSAALSCSVAVALRDLRVPELPDRDLIDIARAAENDYAGAPTGILDQSAALLCRRGHALLLDVRAFRNGTGGYEQIPFDLPGAGLALLVVDTARPHRLVDGGYAARRAQCEAAARALGVESLREVDDPGGLAAIADPVSRRRARHVVTENTRVLEVADHLRAGGDPRRIGPLLSAGHVSLRDDFEVSTPELDLVVDTATAHGAYGARMVGGGFGGSAVALVEAADVAAITAAVRESFERNGFGEPRDLVVEPARGAHRLDPASA